MYEYDRLRFVARRAAFRTILASYLDIAPAAISYLVAERGKPTLAESSIGGIHFNTSSTGTLAAMAISFDHAVGIDIEQTQRDLNFRDLARAYFTPREFLACTSAADGVDVGAFLRIWTRKEAFLKLTGLGLVDDLPNVDVGTGEPAQAARYVESAGKVHHSAVQTLSLAGATVLLSVANPGPGSGLRLIDTRRDETLLKRVKV